MKHKPEEELQATLEALTTLYRGLEVLRREFSTQPTRLQLMAEGPLEEIRRLETELQAYTALFLSPPAVSIWLTLAGKLARWAETPSRVFSASLDSLRKCVQSIATFDMLGRTDTRPTRALLEASDPELVLLQPGSLRLGLRWHHSGQSSFLPTEEAAVTKALATATRAIRELETKGVYALADEEPSRRRVIFRAVASLAPTQRSDVEFVTLSGPQVGDEGPLVLSSRTYELARGAVREVTSRVESSYDGEIRELDLDKKSFKLRHVESVGELGCRVIDTLDFSRIRELLEQRVRVFGVSEEPSPRATFLVTDIEGLDL